MLVRQFAHDKLNDAGYGNGIIDRSGSGYEPATFRWYNPSTRHSEELTDFKRMAGGAGPERFVVAFDVETGECFLRSELRSCENLESLERPTRPSSGGRESTARPGEGM